MNLQDLLDQSGKQYFYLMHLSWKNQPSKRRELWEYSRERARVTSGWDSFGDIKESLKRSNPRIFGYFEMFANMDKGDRPINRR